MPLSLVCRRVLLISLLAALPLAGAVSRTNAQEKPAPMTYPVKQGAYEVVTVEEVILHDKARDKDLPVYINYPKNGGPFPIIVFSHGSGGSGDRVAILTKFWASQGYVCLNPTHEDSIGLKRKKDPNAEVSLTGVLRGGNATTWANRPKDVTFVLDSLDELENKIPALKGKMDRTRIGVGGHSLGAYTAQLIGGAKVTFPGSDKPQSFADKRVKAILQLSGQGTGQQGLTAHSWDELTRPMMTATGSLDRGAGGQGPDWKKEPYDHSPAGNKYHLFIEGANHGSFTGNQAEGAGMRPGARRLQGLGGGVRGAGGDQKKIFGYVEQATLAFWNAYLKDDAAAKAFLKSDALTTESKKAATLVSK